ncbi:MAG TPA: YidC/Oxa1 family membrane protein insertase [Chloroflexia bacterium]|nr:YidC/Oxa1 family membrane protein insertase [Chloroflexia bacterium]
MDFLGAIWSGFSNTLLNILVAINSVIGSPGVAIIVFTILMRFLTVPLTMKALRSSKHMQQIQPLIKEVQRKYGKDRQKVQEETMKLYRDYGINPAAGCLPMLIQLPIFIGLYGALSATLPQFHGTAEEIAKQADNYILHLRSILWNPDWVHSGAAWVNNGWNDAWINSVANFNRPFLWVHSLATADPLFIWPVLSGFFQFIQSRMAMPRRDPNNPMDPQQRMMQNIMQFMPIYIVLISLGFPAGTVIYWAFSSLFGAVQQYFITGFGSLPDLPGLGFLPRKPIEPPKPLHPEEIASRAQKQKKGVMAKMMERALEAQEAQKAAQGQTAAEARAGVTSDAPTVASLKSNGSSRSRSSGASSAHARQLRATATTATGVAPKFSSDTLAVVSDNGSSDMPHKGNGAKAPAQLPRKRKNKR